MTNLKAPLYIVVILPIAIFIYLFSIYYGDFVKSYKKVNPIEIMFTYCQTMLILAMIFSFLFVFTVLTNLGYFYDCDDSNNKILPGYYYSVSNLFSLSYTEPICFNGSVLKLVIASEAILGHVITVIILSLVISAYLRIFEKKKKK